MTTGQSRSTPGTRLRAGKANNESRLVLIEGPLMLFPTSKPPEAVRRNWKTGNIHMADPIERARCGPLGEGEVSQSMAGRIGSSSNFTVMARAPMRIWRSRSAATWIKELSYLERR